MVFAKLMTKLASTSSAGAVHVVAAAPRAQRGARPPAAPAAHPGEEVRSPDERVDGLASDDAQIVGQALAALPEDQRTVVVLRHVVGLTPGEIAERLGKSENSIHGLHHRGRRALQSQLRQLECAPATTRRRAA